MCLKEKLVQSRTSLRVVSPYMYIKLCMTSIKYYMQVIQEFKPPFKKQAFQVYLCAFPGEFVIVI